MPTATPISITQQEFDLLRDYAHKHCGITVGDGKTYLVESRLSQLVAERGCKTFGEFYEQAVADPSGSLRDRIIDALTTHETMWFRDSRPWDVLSEVVLPELAKKAEGKPGTKIRIWSAACSTGQEPYSLAMLIDTMFGMTGVVSPSTFEIVATDISPNALFMAIAGRYASIEMRRGLHEGYHRRYFTEEGNVSVLSPVMRHRVVFRKYNLQDSFTPLGQFDIVFCRNVAIYFSEDFRKDLFAKIGKVLAPGGYLFVGSTESLLGYSTDFEMVQHKQCVYYQTRK